MSKPPEFNRLQFEANPNISVGTIMDNINLILKMAREHLKIRQVKLAEKMSEITGIKVEQGYISKVEHGRTNVTADRIKLFATAMGCPKDQDYLVWLVNHAKKNEQNIEFEALPKIAIGNILDNMKTIIKEVREYHQISQTDIAKEMSKAANVKGDITQGYISKVEKGLTQVSPERIKLFASAMGCHEQKDPLVWLVEQYQQATRGR